jgi:phage/plasmid-like protein (TIGR03299 family)
VLGAGMSEHYGVMQTGVMLDFLDNLVADAGMLYQSAGALHGGKTVWILASLGEEWTIGDSRHVPYILATTTHDGSGSVTVTPTTVNVVCANTLSAAMVSRDEQRINIRHTSGVVDNLRAASDTLKVATADQRRLQEFLATANETAIRCRHRGGRVRPAPGRGHERHPQAQRLRPQARRVQAGRR